MSLPGHKPIGLTLKCRKERNRAYFMYQKRERVRKGEKERETERERNVVKSINNSW